MDPDRKKHYNVGFAGVMPEKEIAELSTDANVEDVMRVVRGLLKRGRAKNEAATPENNARKRYPDDTKTERG